MKVEGRDDMTFPENLKTLRKKRHMTQAKLAEVCGVSQQSVQQWEGGKTFPDLKKINLLRKALQVSADCLIDGTEYIEELSGQVSHADKVLLKKFHALDDRGRETILNILNFEYQRNLPKLEERVSHEAY